MTRADLLGAVVGAFVLGLLVANATQSALTVTVAAPRVVERREIHTVDISAPPRVLEREHEPTAWPHPCVLERQR